MRSAIVKINARCTKQGLLTLWTRMSHGRSQTRMSDRKQCTGSSHGRSQTRMSDRKQWTGSLWAAPSTDREGLPMTLRLCSEWPPLGLFPGYRRPIANNMADREHRPLRRVTRGEGRFNRHVRVFVDCKGTFATGKLYMAVMMPQW